MCFGGQNGVILGRRGGSWAFPGVKPVSGGWGCQECYGVGWFQRCTNLRFGTGVIRAEIGVIICYTHILQYIQFMFSFSFIEQSK